MLSSKDVNRWFVATILIGVGIGLLVATLIGGAIWLLK